MSTQLRGYLVDLMLVFLSAGIAVILEHPWLGTAFIIGLVVERLLIHPLSKLS